MSRTTPCVRFAALLLLTALTLIATVGIAFGDDGASLNTQCSKGETGNESENVKSTQAQDDKLFTITNNHEGNRSYAPGERVTENITIKARAADPSNPDRVTFVWYPPTGATNVDYGSNPPTRLEGGNAVWESVPVAVLGDVASVSISYDAGYPVGSIGPDGPDASGRDASTVNVFWTSADLSTHATQVRSQYTVTDRDGPSQDGHRRMAESAAPTDDTALAAGAPSADEDVTIWSFQRWIGLSQVGITEDNWADWQAGWGDDVHFFGFCYPLGETYTDTYPLPVVWNGTHDPLLMLVSYEGGLTEIAQEPLELAPRYATLLQNTQDEQGYFVALQLPADADLSPEPGIEIPPGSWELYMAVNLDLRGSREAMADEIVYFYVGLDGEGHPDPESAPGLTSGLYQGHGVTVLGPWPIRLRAWYTGDPTADPPVVLSKPCNGDTEPGQRVTATHRLENMGLDAVEVTLAACAESGADVTMLAADTSGPLEPLTPITNPLPLEGSTATYVAMVGEMPAINGGVETWMLTASVPGASRDAEIMDLFWVGDWLAPPIGAPTPMPKRVVLPIIQQ